MSTTSIYWLFIPITRWELH